MTRQGELFRHSPYKDPAAMQRAATSSSTGYVREDDPDVRGLWLRTTKGGVCAWVLSYQVRGRTRTYTIGRADAWSLPQAREEARRLWRLIDQGADPRGERQAAQKAARKPRLSHGGLHPGYSRVRHSFVRSRSGAGLLERWIAKWVDEKGQLHTYQHADQNRVQRRLDRELELLRRYPIVRNYKPRPRRPKPSPAPVAAPVTPSADPRVLEKLTAIERAQQAQDAALAKLTEHQPRLDESAIREALQPVLRQLVELRRAHGLTELHKPPKTSRRNPLGA